MENEKSINENKLPLIELDSFGVSFVEGSHSGDFFSFLKGKKGQVLYCKEAISSSACLIIRPIFNSLFVDGKHKKVVSKVIPELSFFLSRKDYSPKAKKTVELLSILIGGATKIPVVDLRFQDKNEARQIAYALSLFFDESHLVIVLPSLKELEKRANVYSSFELVPAESKPLVRDSKADLDAAFDEFINDLDKDEEPKKESEVEEKTVSDPSKNEELSPIKSPVNQYGDKKPNIKIRLSLFFKKLFTFDEIAKTSLSNLLFTVVFLGLAIATSFLYFSFPNNDKPSFYAICLTMCIVFLLMSLVPVSFTLSDRKVWTDKIIGRANFVIIEVIVGGVLVCLGAFLLLLLGKSNGWEQNKILPFVISFFSYPVISVLFVLGVSLFLKLKKNGKGHKED